MEKQIQVCIGTDRVGNVRARLSLLIVVGAAVASEHFHSVNIAPGEDAAEIRARLEAHLAMEQKDNGVPFAPWPSIPDEEWAKVEGVLHIFNAATAERIALVADIKARLVPDAKTDAVVV